MGFAKIYHPGILRSKGEQLQKLFSNIHNFLFLVQKLFNNFLRPAKRTLATIKCTRSILQRFLLHDEPECYTNSINFDSTVI